MNKGKTGKERSPWAWVPSLYFAQGIPYVVVMSVAVIMYKKLGISNTDIALYTSWLYLPWVIKPFWSPFIDLLKTKRWWIVTMQMLIGAGLAGVAFTIPMDFFFQATLAVFWLIAFSSATHDIAADGFYMLALDSHKQALYVGIRSTFYRIASITGQGILIILAGALETATGLEPAKIDVQVGPQYANEIRLPEAETVTATEGDLRFVVSPSTLQISTQPIPSDSASYMKQFAYEQNVANGFIPAEQTQAAKEKEQNTWWARNISTPFGELLKRNFGNTKSVEATHKLTGGSGIVKVHLSKAPPAGEKIVLNNSFNKGDNSVFLAHGERIEFTEANWDKPAYLVVQVDPKLKEEATASFKGLSGNITFSWSITFFVLAGLFMAFCIYHKFVLPKPDSDKPAGSGGTSPSLIFKEFFETFATFFKKKQAWAAILFMLLYRFPEAQLIKLITPFLIDPRELGGLGLTTGQVGLVYGTVGVIGLTLGGIIGGIVAARGGLKKWLWPMAWSISLTCATFVYLGYFQPESLFVINLCVFIEQFGYGFGFTAYMLYLIYFADGEHKTAHYAICTAFMALGMMVPGMAAGWLQEMIGYENFFYWVMICCAATIVVTAFLKVDPNFGRKAPKEVKE